MYDQLLDFFCSLTYYEKCVYFKTSGFAASRVQSEVYMNCRPPVLAPSALVNRPPVQNWIEEERSSVFLRSGTVSEAP